jgi:hypothetical protein
MNFDTSRIDVGESWWIFTEKGIQNSRQNRVAGESKSTDEEVTKDDNLSVLRGRDLFIKLGSPSARRIEPGFLIFPNYIGCDLGLSEGERGW